MPTLPRFADEGEVILGVDAAGAAFHVKLAADTKVDYGLVGIFPPHQVVGDPTRARHLLLSEFVQSSWSGGGQIARMQESTDPDRYDFATLETRWPHTLTLLPLTTQLNGPNTSGGRPLGMYNGALLVSYGTELRVFAGTPPALSGGGTLTATPNDNGGVEFRGSGTARFFIPYGTGYDVWNGAAVAAGTVGEDVLSFLVWDDKLYALHTDGEIKYSLDGTTWSAVQATLESGWTPRSLQLFRDRGDNLIPYVVTDSHLWAFSPDGPFLVRTEMDPPRHPYHGLAAAPFDGELWTAAGVGAYAYSGPTKRPVGPDRDDSLPAAYRGAIVSFAPFLGGMAALMRGSTGAAVTEAAEHDDAAGEGDAYAAAVTGLSLLMVWDRRGWHTLWVADATGSTPTRVDVESLEDGTYRLVWGFGGSLYWQDISTDFLNPKFATTRAFAPSGTLWFAEFDGGNEAQEKVAASVELRTRQLTASETVTVRYSTDGGQTYQTIGTLTDDGDDGQTTIRLGQNGTLPDGSGRYEGIDFHQFKLALDLARGATTTAKPIVESAAVVYFPKMGTLKSWNFIADGQGEYKGHGPRDVQDHLDGLVPGKFVPFCHQDRWYMVKVTGVSGEDETGQTLNGDRRVSVVQAFEE